MRRHQLHLLVITHCLILTFQRFANAQQVSQTPPPGWEKIVKQKADALDHNFPLDKRAHRLQNAAEHKPLLQSALKNKVNQSKQARVIGSNYQWEKLHTESEGGFTNDIVSVNNVLFMSHYDELFKSSDGGYTWNFVLKAPSDVYGNANFNSDDVKIFTSGTNILFGDHLSKDNGDTWQVVMLGTNPRPSFYVPLSHGLLGSNIYPGTYYHGIYKSTDLGNSYATLNNGLFFDGSFYSGIESIQFYNNQPVISVNGNGLGGGGIWKFDGSSWIKCVGNGLPMGSWNGGTTNFYYITNIGFLNSAWYASTNNGVYVSNDQGTNWTKLNLPDVFTAPWPPVYYKVNIVNGKIYAAYYNDLYISVDGGVTWIHRQLPYNADIKRVTESGNDIVAATSNGVYRSADSGISWQPSNKGFERRYYNAFNTFKDYGNNSFASSNPGGVISSTDKGSSWVPFNNGLNTLNSTIGLYSSNSDLYVNDAGVYKADLSNNAWSPIGQNFPVTYITDMKTTSAGTYVLGSSLFFSANGSTWTNIFQGVKDSNGDLLPNGEVSAILIDQGVFYLGTYDYGFYRSTDNGASWQTLNFNGGGIYQIEKIASTFYLISDAGLYKSSDNGNTWTLIDFSSYNTSTSICYPSSIINDNGRIILGLSLVYSYNQFEKAFILVSDDGINWDQYGSDLSSEYGSAYQLIGNYIYLGSLHGLWRIPFSLPDPIPFSTNITYRSFTVNWNYSSNKANDAVQLFISETSDFSKFVEYDVVESGKSFTVYGLKPSSTYYWKISSPAGNSQVMSITTTLNPKPDNTQLWGVTAIGSSSGDGTNIFSIDADGSDFREIYSNLFTYGFGIIQASDGYVYSIGVTDTQGAGGIAEVAAIYKTKPDGSGAVLFYSDPSFNPNNVGIMEASDGNFYGTNGFGIYKITKSGIFQQIFSLPARALSQTLTEGNDGYLYGVCGSTVYKIDKNGYSVLYTFSIGNGTTGTFVKDLNGDLYGKYYFATDNKARIIKISNGTTVSVIATLPTLNDGSRALMIGSDGYLYSTVAEGLSSFIRMGAIIKMAKDGSNYQSLYTFPYIGGSIPYPNGKDPEASLLEYKGKLYGTCYSNGSTTNDDGTIFSINMDGMGFIKLYDFPDNTPNSPRQQQLIIVDPNAVKASITLTAGSAIAKRNTEVLVPVSVQHFQNIVSSQFEVSWDPAVVTFADVENFGLNGMDQSAFGITQVSSGKLIVSWVEPNLVPQSKADGSSLFSIRFKLTGNYGATTPITIRNVELGEPGVPTYRPVANVITQAGTVTIDPAVTISGNVLYSNNEGIQNAQLNLSGSSTSSTTSNATGQYTFTVAPDTLTDTYTITPSKTNDPNPLNGIDVQDIALIRRQILQTQPFTSPYQWIAADVNQNKTVTTLDIVFIQALILGMQSDFPNGVQWTFLPNDFILDPNDHFTYPQDKTLTLNDLEFSPSVDFIGIKLGDANNSRDNSQSGRIASGDELIFDIRQEVLVGDAAQKLIEIPIRVKNFNSISGYQFTLTWDNQKLEYVSVTNKNTVSSFGDNKIANGKLTVLWDDLLGKSTSLNDKEELFVVRFKSTTGNYKDVNINGAVTEVKVYDTELNSKPYIVTWSELDKIDYSRLTSIYPNPFEEKVFIELYSETAEEVLINITDIMGKNIRQMKWEVTSGKNTLQWDGQDMGGARQAPGIYIFTIQRSQDIVNAKVIMVK